MNVHKAIFRSLLRLGIDATFPSHYMSSKVENQPDLALGFVKKEGSDKVILIGSYRAEKHEAFPNCEVVLCVSPTSRKARVLTCYWPDREEPPSKALEKTIKAWLDIQASFGHNFRRLELKRMATSNSLYHPPSIKSTLKQ